MISGLESTDIEVTVEEIRGLDPVTVDATSVNSSGQENAVPLQGFFLTTY